MKKILLVILAAIAIFLGYVALQPSAYSISREVAMNAAPEAIFPHINNSKKMNAWNPWIELDPKSQVTFSGPEEGVGAKTSWTGGDQLGTGSATVTESVPNSAVKTRLDYTEPFAMTQMAEISLKPSGPQTVVRWSVNGDSPFIARVFCFFMDMDGMIGGTFEKGLNKLKSVVETQPK